MSERILYGKWFSNERGYGFLLMDNDPEEKEYFVHYSYIKMENYKTLRAGQKVSFELVNTDRGIQAHEVTPEKTKDKTMVLAEIIIETENLKEKINQLMIYMEKVSSKDSVITDQATKKLLSLLDKHRSHLILINEINNKTQITVGDSQLSLANAIIILQTIETKIKMLDILIEEDGCVLDVMNVIDHRDKLLDEYTAISKEIKFQEWRIEIDQKSMG